MKVNKILIIFITMFLVLVAGCSNGIKNTGDKIVVEKLVSGTGKYELCNEITSTKEVQNVKDILSGIGWQNAIADMKSYADYTFHFEDTSDKNRPKELTYELWISPNKDKIELIIDGETKYVQLNKEKSQKLFKLITGKSLSETMDKLNNKTLSIDTAIKDGNIVMVSYIDAVSSKTNNDMEIYNINRLDNFIENMNMGTEDKIHIIKYGKNSNGAWVNKLYDLRFDGKKIVDVEYDTYSNPDEFIPSQPLVFSKIIKCDIGDGISYRICYSESEDTSAYLISFNKSSIVK